MIPVDLCCCLEAPRKECYKLSSILLESGGSDTKSTELGSSSSSSSSRDLGSGSGSVEILRYSLKVEE